MAKHGNIQIIEPLKEFELPYTKNKKGNYIILGNKRANRKNISKTNSQRFPDGFIYFIKIVDQDIYKLGVSKNPKRRLSDIDSYLPFDFQILAINYFENVYDIEEYFSVKIEKYKVKREWFKLTISQAKEIMIELHNKQAINERSTG